MLPQHVVLGAQQPVLLEGQQAAPDSQHPVRDPAQHLLLGAQQPVDADLQHTAL